MIKIIDTHTHLDAEEFDEDRAEAFARAREAYRREDYEGCAQPQ